MEPMVLAEMRRIVARVLLVGAILSLQAGGQESSNANPPVELSWVKGKCLRCTSPWTLGSTLFTSRSEAWAIGEAWPPPGGQGIGERVLLHTSDGGRGWREVPRTQHYAMSPSVAFVDPMYGWIETYTVLGDSLLFETRNAGRGWKKIDGLFPAFPTVLDPLHWWGIESTSHAPSADGRFWTRTLVRTADGGHTWSKFAIPYDAGEFPTVKFRSADVGWAANVAGGGIVVFRTTDGGKTWQKSTTAAPNHPTSIRDLFFLDRDYGWLVADYNLKEGINGSGTLVFATIDGGKTWTRQMNDAFQSGFTWLITFSSEHLGIAFVTAPPLSPGSGETALSNLALAYTLDMGAHWRKVTVPDWVYGCQAFERDLLCSANGKGSRPRVLTIHAK
jgi:photosystem II stability/assembly factor-like uncharacterized protein